MSTGNAQFQNDTIAAISTGMVTAGISVVRMSGDEAVAVADRVFEMPGIKSLADQKTHTIHHGHIKGKNGNTIDEVLVMLMRAPHGRAGRGRCAACGTRRIYKESLLKRQDGSFPC